MSTFDREPELARLLALATAPSEHDAVRRAARSKLERLRRGYSGNTHLHTEALTAFWERAGRALGLTGADGRSP